MVKENLLAFGLVALGAFLAGSDLFVNAIFDLVGTGMVIYGFKKLGVKL